VGTIAEVKAFIGVAMRSKEDDMAKDAHNKAAQHHESAAKSHKMAAEHHGKGRARQGS
jgi:hypothetical protein